MFRCGLGRWYAMERQGRGGIQYRHQACQSPMRRIEKVNQSHAVTATRNTAPRQIKTFAAEPKNTQRAKVRIGTSQRHENKGADDERGNKNHRPNSAVFYTVHMPNRRSAGRRDSATLRTPYQFVTCTRLPSTFFLTLRMWFGCRSDAVAALVATSAGRASVAVADDATAAEFPHNACTRAAAGHFVHQREQPPSRAASALPWTCHPAVRLRQRPPRPWICHAIAAVHQCGRPRLWPQMRVVSATIATAN